MHTRYLLILVLIFTLIFSSCIKGKLKLTVSGTVYRDGKTSSGTVRIFDPKDLSMIAENKTMQNGKFLIREVPPGEWLIGLTGRTGGLIGNYNYVKVGSISPVSDLVLEISEEDPKAKELIAKYQKSEQ